MFQVLRNTHRHKNIACFLKGNKPNANGLPLFVKMHRATLKPERALCAFSHKELHQHYLCLRRLLQKYVIVLQA